MTKNSNTPRVSIIAPAYSIDNLYPVDVLAYGAMVSLDVFAEVIREGARKPLPASFGPRAEMARLRSGVASSPDDIPWMA